MGIPDGEEIMTLAFFNLNAHIFEFELTYTSQAGR